MVSDIHGKQSGCNSCQSVVVDDDEKCTWCGQTRPRQGWSILDDDPWVGQTMHGFRFEQRLNTSDFLYRVSDGKIAGLEAQIFRLNRLAVDFRWDRRIDRVLKSVPARSFLHILRVWETDDYGVIVYMPAPGISLKRWRALEIDIDTYTALSIVEAILQALSPIHELGIHHGALDPDAFMVRTERDNAVQLVTLGGILQGSTRMNNPAFGPRDPRDDASDDIYSLGALIYWLATNSEPPVSGISEKAGYALHDFADLAGLVGLFTAASRPASASEALPHLRRKLSQMTRMIDCGRVTTPAPVESGEFTPPTVVNPVTGEVFEFEDLFE